MNTNMNGKRLEILVRAVISEGELGLMKREFIAEEREVLEPYLPFFEVERLVESDGHSKAKGQIVRFALVWFSGESSSASQRIWA
jgi:hypothetical protein